MRVYIYSLENEKAVFLTGQVLSKEEEDKEFRSQAAVYGYY